jgi:thymidine kinase
MVAKLYFNFGTMNSSKTANMLMTRHNYVSQGKKVLIFKPTLDTRDGAVVKSRALDEHVPAEMVGMLDRGKMYKMAKEFKPDAVLIDEVQFMAEFQVDELGRIVDTLNIPVMAYGLMTDFQSTLFAGSRRLIELGAKLVEVKTVCYYCDNKAVYNMRFDGDYPVFDGDQVQVGGNESYKPVCRSCYTKSKDDTLDVRLAI